MESHYLALQAAGKLLTQQLDLDRGEQDHEGETERGPGKEKVS